MEIKLTIDHKSQKMLQHLHKNFRKEFIKGLVKAMFYVEAEAKKNFNKSNTPKVRTGHLRRSISTRVRENLGGASGILSANTSYARILEFGGYAGRNHQTRIPELPYLRPAFKDINKISDIISEYIVDNI